MIKNFYSKFSKFFFFYFLCIFCCMIISPPPWEFSCTSLASLGVRLRFFGHFFDKKFFGGPKKFFQKFSKIFYFFILCVFMYLSISPLFFSNFLKIKKFFVFFYIFFCLFFVSGLAWGGVGGPKIKFSQKVFFLCIFSFPHPLGSTAKHFCYINYDPSALILLASCLASLGKRFRILAAHW